MKKEYLILRRQCYLIVNGLCANNEVQGFYGKWILLWTARLKGVFAGAFITALVQSSSETTVLSVGFISSGLTTLSESF
ncbi:hypothetical protein HQ496_07655 [bacterium]|nr:hypothetical protein [bacterium]